MTYNKFSYIYPPRPENKIPSTGLDAWDNGSMIGQIKLNGSNSSIYTDGNNVQAMGRHRQVLTNFKLSKEEIIETLYKPLGLKNTFLVINGEYLNKSKNDEKGLVFNHKLSIFDILVYDSDYLVGKTFLQRTNLLDEMYGTKDSDKPYLYGISDNIYRVKSYDKGFKSLYDNYTPIDMVEGVVLKRKNAKLELGTTEINNSKSQIKSRKGTKNYKF